MGETITLTRITDPETIGLTKVTAYHWVTPDGRRAIRQRSGAAWWWRNEDGSEGVCPDRSTALTMLAFHTAELSALTTQEPSNTCEP